MEEGHDEVRLIAENSSHPWVRKRAELVCKLIGNNSPSGNFAVVEIGCGPGVNLEAVRKAFPQATVLGVDLSDAAGEYCAQKGIRFVKKDFFAFDGEGKFDFVLMMDFLEHVQEDEKAVRKACGMLKNGGKLIVMAPANRGMFSQHDRALGHFRRYEISDMKRLADASGMKLLFSSHWNCVFFPAVYISRKISGGKGGELGKRNAALEFLLGRALSAENHALLSGIPLPFGTSVFAVIGKKIG